MPRILLADIGGTKIASALADENGKIVSRVQVESESKDAEALFKILLTSFFDALYQGKTSHRDIHLIGLGVPGMVDSEKGLAVYQNNLPWRNFPLAARLKASFPYAQVTMNNDVYMAAFGEWKARKLGKETLVYVTISTGIAACIINEGKIMRGTGMAGEIGLNVLEYNAQEIKTLEMLASGPAIESEVKQIYNDLELSTKKSMEVFRQQDPQAMVIIQKAARNIARGLHQIFSLLDPHVIVLGGGVINHQPQFLNVIKQELKPLIQNPVQEGIEDRIQLSHYKGDAGLQGALLFANEMKKS